MFLYFKEKNVDIAILETGLGGRLDATNVIKQNLCSIITHIDLDHTDRLGNTKDKIAYEKAGIIKKGCPVITAEGYEAVNKDVTVEVQQSDSTTGVNMAAEGTADIGMASRDLKDEEKDLGLTATVIARDGIAVIVNKDNDVDELTSDQVKAVYTGETTTWEDLAK